jgi:hypothetical protein
MTDLAVLIFALLMPLDLDGRDGAGCGRDAGRQDGREEVEREVGICPVGGALRRLAAFGLGLWSSERGATSQRTSFAQSSSVYVSLRSVLWVMLRIAWSGREAEERTASESERADEAAEVGGVVEGELGDEWNGDEAGVKKGSSMSSGRRSGWSSSDEVPR